MNKDTRKRKSLLDQYPVTKIIDCIFCNAEISLARRGSGKPWRGRLDYWYTEDPVHNCPEREANIDKAQLLQLGRMLEVVNE